MSHQVICVYRELINTYHNVKLRHDKYLYTAQNGGRFEIKGPKKEKQQTPKETEFPPLKQEVRHDREGNVIVNFLRKNPFELDPFF